MPGPNSLLIELVIHHRCQSCSIIFNQNAGGSIHYYQVLVRKWVVSTALLKVDFGSRSQSRVPDFYSTFVKKSTLKSTLLDFKSG